MLAMGWLFFLTSYPVFYLMVAYPSLATAIFAVGWLNLVKAGYSGVLPSLISELFPVETRAVGVALQLQHLGDDLRRLRPVRRNLADRADRRRAFAGLLPDVHRAAEHHRPDGGAASFGTCPRPDDGSRLAGKIALITGASRGIGAAVAERFAREGAHLVLAARTVGGLEEVDDTHPAAGGSATLVPLDLRDFIKIDELAAALFSAMAGSTSWSATPPNSA